MKSSTTRRFVAATVLLAASLLLRLTIPHLANAFPLFPAYRELCKGVTLALATVASLVPFALWDIAVVVVILGTLACAVARLLRRRPILPLLSRVTLLAATCCFLFVGWGLNHYAPSLASEMGLEVGRYSTEELAAATDAYLKHAAELSVRVPRDDDGRLAKQDFFELARAGGASFVPLSQQYPVFAGPQVPVKALFVAGEPLLLSGHTGIYVAPTGEACVPLNCARTDLPFIMCHEASHRLAIASEQEANFAAFLACSTADDVRFAYSGYYNAFVYCYNALFAADAERARSLLSSAAQADPAGVGLVLGDWQATSEHYDAYEGPLKDAGTVANDTYLKSFGEESGVRSYGLVVDYLIAWHYAQ